MIVAAQPPPPDPGRPDIGLPGVPEMFACLRSFTRHMHSLIPVSRQPRKPHVSKL